MFIVIKKDYTLATNNIRMCIIGVFNTQDEAINIAQAHSIQVLELINDKEKIWQVEYEKRGHKYQIIVYEIFDNSCDEIELLNAKLNNNMLGYAFTW